MSYQTSDIKKNLKFKMDNAPWTVVDFQFVKPGKGTAFTWTKMKNLLTGQVIERNFRSGEVLEEVDVENKDATFSYKDGDQYILMDSETFDTFPVTDTHLGDAGRFIMEGMALQVLFYEGRPVSVDLPNFIEIEVTYTEPAVKGDTANNVTKEATIATGATVRVPLFIDTGTIIRIDTRTGDYQGRINTK